MRKTYAKQNEFADCIIFAGSKKKDITSSQMMGEGKKGEEEMAR